MLAHLRSFLRLFPATIKEVLRSTKNRLHLMLLGLALLFIFTFVNRVNASDSETFWQPPEIHSIDGVLSTELVAAPAKLNINGQSVESVVYNGFFVPPTLRISPGDTIDLKLVNQSSDPTNIHYHGFNVTPIPPSDSIFVNAEPGGSYNYRVPIPSEHRRGLYWYHSHEHMSSERQVMGGLSGGIIIDGLLDDIPELQGIQERVLLLKDIQIDDGKIPEEIDPSASSIRTLNGLVNPTIAIAPGETQLWRIGNIGADLYYRIELEGHKLYQVAQDGNRLNRIIPRRRILLPPGKRVEVLVQGGKEGVYALKALNYNTGPQGDRYPGTTLATLRSQGLAQTPIDIPKNLPPLALDLRQSQITNQRTIVFSETSDGNTFFINGKQFDPNRIDTRIPFGSLERWIVKNESGEQHVFHIHQIDFQVASNGVPQEFVGYQDTINVLPGGKVELLMPFTDSVIVGGKFVYHCHILGHEDGGMMAVAEVFNSSTSDTTLGASDAMSDISSSHEEQS